MKLVNRIFRVGRNADIRDEMTEATTALQEVNRDAKSLIVRIQEETDREEQRLRRAVR